MSEPLDRYAEALARMTMQRDDLERELEQHSTERVRQRKAEEALATARESTAALMIAHSFATGHGDSIEDLLLELDGQLTERSKRLAQFEQVTRELLAALRLAKNTVECASIDRKPGSATQGEELPWYKAAKAAIQRATAMLGDPPVDCGCELGDKCPMLPHERPAITASAGESTHE